MAICDAPGAAIIGINKSGSYIEDEGLLHDYPSCIFVCLDEEKIYMDKNFNKLDIPQFGNIEKTLLPHYAKFNADLNYKIVDLSKSKAKAQAPAKKAALKFAGNPEVKEKCIKVLEVFKTALEERIIKLIPAKPILKPDQVNFYSEIRILTEFLQELDYGGIAENMLKRAAENDKPFLKQFFETQIFIYHLEKHFEKR